LTRADGVAISTSSTSYKVYVLAKGNQGFGDILSAVSPTVAFSITAKGTSKNLLTPTVSDIANNNNETDLRVILRRNAIGEAGYTATNTYRIYVVPNTTDDATFRASSWFTNTNYYAFNKLTSSLARTYVKTLTAGTKDSTGAAIVEGTAYRIYVAAIGTSGTVADSVLSPKSRVITLSPNVPGTIPVRLLTAAKTGTGFDSNNISVSFTEPVSVSLIQDYRIFIVSANATMSLSVANTNATVANNCYVYTPTPPTRSTSRTVTLPAGIKAYDGTGFNTLVSKGAYKVYVLSYTGTAYGNKLSTISVGTVTLD
jgi:hypothetical protein